MVDERDGWFVVNVKEANWRRQPRFGHNCNFEVQGRFPDVGIRIALLEPGKPNCRYHRESVQEDFLVLSGRCRLLINGEERQLGPWDFVHCPPGATHVFVGEGDTPCAVLMIGHRQGDGHELFYPASELARRFGAEAPQATPDPAVAYSDVEAWEHVEAPTWPPG